MRTGGCLAVLLLMSCGEGPSGPALEPRPDVQTCLPDISGGWPERISDTGCFADPIDPKALEPGLDLIPYEVNSALWTDGAFKPRYLVVPSPKTITIREDDSWAFPEGSVLIKVFGLEFEVGDPESRRAVETRFMVRQEGRWHYATYRWNDEGTDAERLEGGAVATYTIYEDGEPRELEYGFPSESECTTCHGMALDDVLGPKTAQINRERDNDGVIANQLSAMCEIDLFALDPDEALDPESEPRMANPQQDEGSLEEQVRAYLDANCSHCHRPSGYADTADHGLDLRYELSLEETGLCDSMRYWSWSGVPRIAPGNPDGSGVLQRFVLDDALRMPSTGTSTIDRFGESLLRDWIAGLDACP